MNNHLIDLEDLSIEQLYEVIELAGKIMKDPAKYSDACKGKILATLFYEPSTRTQMSFQTAMLKLGGSVIGFSNPQNSSVSKGESLKDTIVVMSGYADIIAMRNPVEGSASAASEFSDAPLINAGDGGHLHPTQTLTDVVTLYNEVGRLDHLKIGLCGDLKNGRTVHSLIKTLSNFEGNSFVLISTKELGIPDYIKDIMIKRNCKFEEVDNLISAIGNLDMLYMTRIQRERFASIEEYEAQKGIYILDTDKLKCAKKDMIILHPLPRVDEITVDVDSDPRACYFKQAVYGMYGRMALILTLLNNQNYIKSNNNNFIISNGHNCSNPKCVTKTEKYLDKAFLQTDKGLVCKYCDHLV